MTTGQRIKAARKQSGLTQAELAVKLGIPYQSISQWERDIRNPKIETLQRIAAALGVRTDTLMGQGSFDEVLERGIISPSDIANEMVMPIERVLEVINHPESVSPEIADKVFQVGSLLAVDFMQSNPYSVRISVAMEKLNDAGQQEAVKRVEELTEVRKYQK